MNLKNNITQQLTSTFELSISEQLELKTLRQENDLLKKKRAELGVKIRRDKYEAEAIQRKHQKHIEKLQLEINALKVIHSGISLNDKQSETPLRLKAKQQKAHWQNKLTFSTTG